jgi:TM2 domain-containing membrane protein YozV
VKPFTYIEKDLRRIKKMRNAGAAAVLSFLLPGVGQIYNGKIWRGIFWLIVTPGLWIGSGGTLGWICHLISAYTAFSYAETHPFRHALKSP